jgi:CBS domain-containing protein
MDRLMVSDDWTRPISRCMRGDFALVNHREPLSYARLLMRMKGVSCLLVIGDCGPAGVVWERDLRARTVLERYGVSGAVESLRDERLCVGDVMRRPVPVLRPETTARDGLRVLRAQPCGCAVVAENGNLLGLVTSADLIRHVMDAPSAAVGK